MESRNMSRFGQIPISLDEGAFLNKLSKFKNKLRMSRDRISFKGYETSQTVDRVRTESRASTKPFLTLKPRTVSNIAKLKTAKRHSPMSSNTVSMSTAF